MRHLTALLILLAAGCCHLSGQVFSNATKLRGYAICGDAPANGKYLGWDAARKCWTPTAGAGGGGVANYAVGFAAETTKTVTAATHGFDTSSLIGACYDSSSNPWKAVDGYTMTVDSTTYEVKFIFPVNFTGTCVISGSSSSGGGGGGAAVEAGDGIVITGDDPKTIAIDSAVVPYYLKGTLSYDFGAIANGACDSKAFSLPGAKTGMTGIVAASTALAKGANLQLVKVTATDQVTIELCNLTGTSFTPTTGLTYTVTLLGAL